MKRILTLVALLLACVPAFGAILQNAYTSNTTAQADAHVLALDTNAPPLPANAVTNPWPNSLIVTGALSVASSTYPDTLLEVNPAQGIFDAGDIGFDHNKTFININDLTAKTITVSATNGTQFYGPVTGSFRAIGGNVVTNDQPFLLLSSSTLSLSGGLFIFDVLNSGYDIIEPDLNGRIKSTVGFSGPFFGDGSGLTSLSPTAVNTAILATFPPGVTSYYDSGFTNVLTNITSAAYSLTDTNFNSKRSGTIQASGFTASGGNIFGQNSCIFNMGNGGGGWFGFYNGASLFERFNDGYGGEVYTVGGFNGTGHISNLLGYSTLMTNTMVLTASIGWTNLTSQNYLISITAGSAMAMKDPNNTTIFVPVINGCYPVKQSWGLAGIGITAIAVAQ